ncbi:histidine phosphatase family protein [Mycolicibacterium grossiae]|uniref:Histidine phosphatase family protein n=1 Tax=Mycolicibacterium grossiae TaxID=1552759 RepID=A0A1E8PYF9_9MYCO|nr:histidine phosphatase family protein [Mycolicibacterium grossiae]OFJ51315.1 histidine phosphatase family protein [Mycolicibacterium grossiae]QEM48021.1 histidine phosphatase family protein [Mycolicibacterium grossiae]
MTGRLVLVRHGQSHANVDRRLDTRPPGAPLTELGLEQARIFARTWEHPVGLLAHSVAQRAVQTAGEIGAQLGLPTTELQGIHEVQAGDYENRNDEPAIDAFHAVYERWQLGHLEERVPGGESGAEVLDRYLPVVKELRVRYLDDDAWRGDVVVVSHGAAIRLVGAVLGGVDGGFALEHHLANTECVVLSPITDGRWSCLQWGRELPPFAPEPDPQPDQDLESADPMG